MTLDITKKTVLLVIALALTVVFIIFGVFVPTIANIKNTTADTDSLRTYLEQKYEQSINNHVTRNKIKEIKESSAGFSAYVFKKGDELTLITYLENLAAKYNLNQSISNSNIDKMPAKYIDISLDISGDYVKVLEYLSDIESSDYFLNVEQLQFTPAFDRSGQPTQSTDLNLTLGLYASQ